MAELLLLHAVVVASPPPPAHSDACVGEFSLCNETGACTLTDCSACGKGQYRCPLSADCVDDAAAYVHCPGLAGTHLDWTLDDEARLDRLVAATNLTERLSQLVGRAPALPRHGIPGYNWLNDDVHGLASGWGTMFPSGNALGATWNRSALREVAHAIGREARASHSAFAHSGNRGMGGGLYSENGVGITMYAPNINLVRSPLWGRAMEVYGEDPLLTAELAVAFVAGAQARAAAPGAGPGTGRLLAGACCKHLAAYDLENLPVGRVQFDARVPSRDMAETYLPAFRACVARARAVHVMCSFNSVNGVPACANKGLLTAVLREQWGFDGFVVSEYVSVGWTRRGGGTAAVAALPAALRAGTARAANVTSSFRRLYRARLRLGMLDPPDPARTPWNALRMEEECQTAARAAQARRAAEQALTLLRNHAGTLPLPAAAAAYEHRADGSKSRGSPASCKSGLAVIGPFADDGNALLGNYATPPAAAGTPADPVSVLAGVRARLPGTDVIFQPGCDGAPCPDGSLFAQAQGAARAAKATVLVLGLQPHGDGCQDSVACEGEGSDRTSIAMPGRQAGLAAALARNETGSPLVCVLVHGGSLALGSLLRDCDALLDAYYPGCQGGHAVARAIFGDVAPAGRSPVTWYRNDSVAGRGGAVAAMGEMRMRESGLTYRFAHPAAVEVPFGAGAAVLGDAGGAGGAGGPGSVLHISPCDWLLVSVRLANTGARDGDEVVQLYVGRPGNVPLPEPAIRLANFTRVSVARGATTTVSLALAPRARAAVREVEGAFWDPEWVAQGGALELWIGGVQPGFPAFGRALRIDVKVSGSAPLASCGHQA
eukprot:g5271.t1